MRKSKQKARKKSRITLPLVIIIYILALLILLYPIVSNKLAERNQLQVVDTYNAGMDETADEELKSERAKADKYNVSLFQNRAVLTDPFDPNAPDFPDGNYDELLTTTDAMAYVEIPKIKVELPVYHGTSEKVLSKGVGHLKGSSLPVGGVGTHAVLSAHCGLPTAELFTNLSKLEKGDMFFVTALKEKMAYRVDAINVVEPEDTELLHIDENKDYVTLITCTPYAVNTHRLLVRGVRTEYVEEDYLNEQQKAKKFDLSFTPIEIVQLIAILLSIVPLVMFIRMFVFKKKKEDDDETA